MTNQEILTKAIEKALNMGWSPRPFWTLHMVHDDNTCAFEWENSEGIEDETWHILEVIYDHDFAKALWGEAHSLLGEPWKADWQEHLQQMVIADDPIKYLEQFVV